MVTPSERRRLRLCFGIFGCLALTIAGRLVHVQLGSFDPPGPPVEQQRERQLVLPPRRGMIKDRNGELLAYDRAVLEVRAEVWPRESGLGDIARDLAAALATDPEVTDPIAERAAHATKLERRLRTAAEKVAEKRAKAAAEGDEAQAKAPLRVDVLVATEVASTRVLDELLALERRANRGDPRFYRLRLHVREGRERAYPEREATLGPVGFLWQPSLREVARTRMEAVVGLDPRPQDRGRRVVYQDARARRYWTAKGEEPAPPPVLHSTLDLDLQIAAHEELQRALDLAARHGANAKAAPEDNEAAPPPGPSGSPAKPVWGAIVVVDVASGDVLAMSSHQLGRTPRGAAFTPAQFTFEPGSVVKPLVFAIALEQGVIDWDRDQIDCRSSGHDHRWRLPHFGGRWIRDDHACGVLSPHDVLVQSSNIGAVKVGLLCGREGLEQYLRVFGFGRRTALGLPWERAGSRPPNLLSLAEKFFWRDEGPSVSFGYALTMTPLQLARAYLTLLSGGPRELRLYTAIEQDGRRVELPAPAVSEHTFSDVTVLRLVTAMTDVVSDAPNATGRTLWKELRAAGVPPGVVGGKTGTSVSIGPDRTIIARSATFVGFAPAVAPRWLAVCVLQKDGAAGFYGGMYAAPAVGRLLVHALRRSAADVQRVQLVRAGSERIDAGGGHADDANDRSGR